MSTQQGGYVRATNLYYLISSLYTIGVGLLYKAIKVQNVNKITLNIHTVACRDIMWYRHLLLFSMMAMELWSTYHPWILFHKLPFLTMNTIFQCHPYSGTNKICTSNDAHNMNKCDTVLCGRYNSVNVKPTLKHTLFVIILVYCFKFVIILHYFIDYQYRCWPQTSTNWRKSWPLWRHIVWRPARTLTLIMK